MDTSSVVLLETTHVVDIVLFHWDKNNTYSIILGGLIYSIQLPMQPKLNYGWISIYYQLSAPVSRINGRIGQLWCSLIR